MYGPSALQPLTSIFSIINFSANNESAYATPSRFRSLRSKKLPYSLITKLM